MRLEVPSVLAFLLTVGVSAAQVSAAQGETRQHDAHAHGHGKLNVVVAPVDGDGRGEMLIELQVPGVHVAGFEHVPNTDAEHEAIRVAKSRLREGTRWFIASADARCELEHIDLAMSYEAHDDESKHETHGHKKDDHGHDDDKHGKHDDDAKEHKEEQHASLHAEYHFECANIAALKQVRVDVFDGLRNLDTLASQVDTTTKQTQQKLRAADRILHLPL